jgi:midasin (ATPase involved in ribosome maturation)
VTTLQHQAGKTSLIEHLARVTGNTFVRINNHEHTDIQEYMGSYLADTQVLPFISGNCLLWVALTNLQMLA